MLTYLYILRTGDDYYKVGLAEDVNKRVSQLQTGCPTIIEVNSVFKVLFPYEIEKDAHRILKPFSIGREWFQVPHDKVDQFLQKVATVVKNGNDGKFNKIIEDTWIQKSRELMKKKKYKEGTEKLYVRWIKEFMERYPHFEPSNLGDNDLTSFINEITNRNSHTKATVDSALNAIRFFYANVLHINIGNNISIKNSRPKESTPHTLIESDILNLISVMNTPENIQASLLYECGLLVNECVRIRIRDVDLENNTLAIRDSEDRIYRELPISVNLNDQIKAHLNVRKYQHSSDIENNSGYVALPPEAATDEDKVSQKWEWQYIFTSRKLTRDLNSGRLFRKYKNGKSLQRAVKKAVRASGVDEKTTCMTLRHSFALNYLKRGFSIIDLREVLGKNDDRSYTKYLKLIS